jgi:hypothetical protein
VDQTALDADKKHGHVFSKEGKDNNKDKDDHHGKDHDLDGSDKNNDKY